MTWRGWHPDDTECAIRLWNAGHTTREIAEIMGKTKRQMASRLQVLRNRPDKPLRVFTREETVAKADGYFRDMAELRSRVSQ